MKRFLRNPKPIKLCLFDCAWDGNYQRLKKRDRGKERGSNVLQVRTGKTSRVTRVRAFTQLWRLFESQRGNREYKLGARESRGQGSAFTSDGQGHFGSFPGLVVLSNSSFLKEPALRKTIQRFQLAYVTCNRVIKCSLTSNPVNY